ncbi:MAG: DUF262 domain-containing protein [Candidatus Aminicenantes bacterium]|nr:DUF262 domain-containing protein [Candidatus Aminicenantes bacterium]
MTKESRLYSIGELINQLTSDYVWKLSIAQRAFEWNKIRVTNLVDSLLRGFPIGNLLLVKSKRPYYKFSSKEELHKKIKNIKEAEHTHIIDGQQRCVAILATFAGKGLFDKTNKKTEYLWINISKHNYQYKEFDEKRGQKYFCHWSSSDRINGLIDNKRRAEKLPPGSPINGWIPFHNLVELVRSKASKEKIYIDAKCNDSQEVDEETLNNLVNSIKSAINKKRIPIHILEDDELEDIFHVFIRINTGGLPLGPVDVFFAGVKKYWNDAEEHLKCIVNKKTIFKRQDAISLLARCAGKSLEGKTFDPVRLRLQHLTYNSSKGRYPLIIRMQELTPKDGDNDFIQAVKWTSKLVRSRFYYASSVIGRFNVMSVVAWAYQFRKFNKSLPKLDDKEYIKPIINFLFWTSVYNSRYYGRTGFDRVTFEIAWESGSKGDVFPYYTNRDMRIACFDYHYVRPLILNNPNPSTLNLNKLKENSDDYKDAEKIFNLTKGHTDIFLSIYQEIKYSKIDWDHLIAYNFARNRFKKGRDYLWEHIKWISMIGNFAGIDSRANRILQDKGPSYKFLKQSGNGPIQNYTNPYFIKTDPCLTRNDIKQCIQIEELLKNKFKEQAGDILHDFVANRTLLIWKHICRVIGRPPKPFQSSEE